MIYIDTSALLKRYIREAKSDEFDQFFIANGDLHISRLCFVEARCALARRRRAKQISRTLEPKALDTLRQDLQDGAISIHAVSDQHIVNAYHLIEQLANLPLRTLDALHLAIAQGIAATGIASADAHQIAAAKQLHFEVYPFTRVSMVKAHE